MGSAPTLAVGYLIFLAAIVLLVLAFLARSGGPARVRWSGVLLGLIVVQILLAWAGGSTAWLGILHGMNALAVAGVAGSLAGREWAAHRGGGPRAPGAGSARLTAVPDSLRFCKLHT